MNKLYYLNKTNTFSIVERDEVISHSSAREILSNANDLHTKIKN